ncbi:fimbria/pilus periplasmic chaperone [Hafnia alvei]|uniref:Fimbrial chaperone protein n=1 Tax=Hafnia alvei TaxID=569 RepID=A0A1C6Z1U6_HAFAL|nr:fimbria/pilus periplasmic chaperone [Hafnia alvei]NLS52102.1 fimbria/pilus periplasmic chaperone [Hafnia alvei]SCM53170.1 fimbrial chaperone protein [Hafnia alvei]
MKNVKVNSLINLLLFSSISLCGSSAAIAGGVGLGTTRVIYPQNSSQASLSIQNTDASKVFLIQSWVSNPDENKSADFIITPPIFVIQPKKENTMRIMFVGKKPLPTDRESLYYVNSKAIPSGKPEEGKNTLQIATQTTIKMFVRPDNLPTPSIDAPKSLRCKLIGSNLNVKNPSPYYVTLVSLKVGNQKMPNTMVPPKSEAQVPLQGGPGGNITFQTMNDYGAMTDQQTCSI